MRLWHQSLISLLPNNQLKGQHRECCALRGNGWGKKHSTVNYVFEHNPYLLYLYHQEVIFEIGKRILCKKMNYNVNENWNDPYYRGSSCFTWDSDSFDGWENDVNHDNYQSNWIYFKEHDNKYYKECKDNLESKGILI